MKKLESMILWLWTAFCGVLTYWLPKNRHRVVFASYFGAKPSRDFQLVSQELLRLSYYDMVFIGQRFTGDFKSKLKYMVSIIRQAYYFNTSGAFIIDGNNPLVNICRNKRSAKVIQLWHAAGALKKFGADAQRRYKLKGYDAIVVSSKNIVEHYARALNTPIECVHPLGKARTDMLLKKRSLNKLRAEVLSRYPELNGKKIVLYAPTFRGNGAGDIRAQEVDVTKLGAMLGDEYALVCKFHPLIANKVKGDFIDLSSDSLYRIFSVADVLVTDYSSVCIEFSLLNRPIVMFTPDLQDYIESRGLYYDLEDIAPGPICMTVEETAEAIRNASLDEEKMERFRKLFFDKFDGKTAERIAAMINKIMRERI